MVMSGQQVNLTTLLLGRLRPPKRLTSIKCPYFASNWQLPFLSLSQWKERFHDQFPQKYVGGTGH